MTKYYFFISLLAMSVIFTGCATKHAPEITLYSLNLSAEAVNRPLQGSVFPNVIKVSIPQSSADIMSRQILYQDKNYTQNSYLYSRWREIPNKMLAQLLLSYLNQKPVFKTVLPAYSKGREEFLLESTLLEFYHHINSDGSSSGRVRIKFYLIDIQQHGRVVAAKEFFSYIDSSSLDASGAVSALNSAAQTIASDLVLWLSAVDI